MKTLLDKLRRSGSEKTAMNAKLAEQPIPDHRILFVCMGNICRSPTAEGVFRHIAASEAPELVLEIDSAGTHAYHVGEPPDVRAQRAAQRRGIDLGRIRARRVAAEDFSRYDLIVAMDKLNVALLEETAPPEHRDRIKLFLEYAPHLDRAEVPDPYYGGSNGFELVLDLVEDASRGLLRELTARVAKTR